MDTNGIIIDLSDNKGGHPDAVSNLLGYFVENRTIYDSFYIPSIDKSFDDSIRGAVKGHKLIDVPLGIIVYERTASVAKFCALPFKISNRERYVVLPLWGWSIWLNTTPLMIPFIYWL